MQQQQPPGSHKPAEPDVRGRTRLHWAADEGKLKDVLYLVEMQGLDVNAPDDRGRTPLDYALTCSHTEVAEALQKLGARRGTFRADSIDSPAKPPKAQKGSKAQNSGTPAASSTAAAPSASESEPSSTSSGHKFWAAQPANRPGESSQKSGAIVDRAEDLISLRADASLPEGFAAAEIKLEKGAEQTQRVLRDVYRLLMEEEEESSDEEDNDSPFLALFRTANARLFGFEFKPSEAMHAWLLCDCPSPQWFLGIYQLPPPAAASLPSSSLPPGTPASSSPSDQAALTPASSSPSPSSDAAHAGRLVAFVAATALRLRVRDSAPFVAVEVHSLCVAPELRGKRFTPYLLQEIGKRVRFSPQRIAQAVFGTSVPLPITPLANCRHYARPLDPVVCLKTGFTKLPQGKSRTDLILKNRLPPRAAAVASDELRVRTLQKSDLAACGTLLSAYLSRFKLAPLLSEQELEFKLLTRPPFVYSFVVEETAAGGAITDFFSFYCLRCPCYLNRVKSELHAACMSYCAPSRLSLQELVVEAMHQAADPSIGGCALMLLVDNYGHAAHLKALRFKPVAHSEVLYQIYNWRAEPMTRDDVGLIFW